MKKTGRSQVLPSRETFDPFGPYLEQGMVDQISLILPSLVYSCIFTDNS